MIIVPMTQHHYWFAQAGKMLQHNFHLLHERISVIIQREEKLAAVTLKNYYSLRIFLFRIRQKQEKNVCLALGTTEANLFA